jgi:hypothetical protein
MEHVPIVGMKPNCKNYLMEMSVTPIIANIVTSTTLS